jgi:hypothetical protein
MTAGSRMVALLLSMAWAVAGQQRLDVYFLAVGSEHYVEAPGRDVNSLPTIDGMIKSARAVAGVLDSGGSAFGIALVSGDRHFVSLRDIDAALDVLNRRIRSDRPARPLLVFYFAGHGVSEGVAWNHFSLPGNFAFRGPLAALSIEGLAKATLHASDLVDRLEKGGVPFIVVLDTCYEGKPESFRSPVLTGPAVESLRGTAAVLRYMNEFHDTGPVLFSTNPGTTVAPVPDPRDPSPQVTGVAPLARRFLLIGERIHSTLKPLTLSQFLACMGSQDFDPMTGPAVTHSQPPAQQGDVLLVPEVVGGKSTEITGTANAPALCCGASVLGGR